MDEEFITYGVAVKIVYCRKIVYVDKKYGLADAVVEVFDKRESIWEFCQFVEIDLLVDDRCVLFDLLFEIAVSFLSKGGSSFFACRACVWLASDLASVWCVFFCSFFIGFCSWFF